MRKGSAVERSRSDDVIAVLRQREQRCHLRRHAGRGGQSGAAPFQGGDALFQCRDRRIGDARIDVAEGLKVEKTRGVVCAVEYERCCLIDRQRT